VGPCSPRAHVQAGVVDWAALASVLPIPMSTRKAWRHEEKNPDDTGAEKAENILASIEETEA
jgi:hypothetical protein